MALLFSSCHKQGTAVNVIKRMDVTLGMNQAYQFPINGIPRHEAAQISVPALFAQTSVINPGSDASEAVYNYVPQANYTGQDQVSIVVGENEMKCQAGSCNHQGQCCNHGGCHHDDGDADDQTTTYILTFHILRQSTTATLPASGISALK